MKPFHFSGIALLSVALLFALAIANLSQPIVSAQNSGSAALYLQGQATLTPTVKDTSVIGSTDGIMIMGFVIVIIVIVPILFRKKQK